MSEPRQPVIEFPCIFPLKAIGHNRDDFETFVVGIVRQHAPQSTYTVESRPSRGDRFLAVTVTFVAETQEQLDAIYLELSSHRQRVLFAI